MYLKGKIKIGLKNEVRNGSECYELINYVNELNNKFQNKKNDSANDSFFQKNKKYMFCGIGLIIVAIIY